MADLFEQSEGSRADLKNLLSLALQRVECNIYLAQLMIWVFNTADDTKPLKKSYDQLASRPYGLCCSYNQARATVKKAQRLRILNVKESWAGPGIQGANEYSIDWEGVRRIVAGRRDDTGATTWQAGATICHPGATTEQAGATICHPLKGIHLLTPSCTLNPPTAKQEPAAAGLVLVRSAKTKTRESVLADVVPPDQVLAWQAILQRVADLGVYAELGERLLVQAAQRGACPADMTALADHFESQPGAWTPGALTVALKRWSPGQPYDAAALWPAPSEASRKWRF